MLFYRDADPALSEILDWDLSDFVPEFSGLTTPGEIKPAFDRLCENSHFIINEMGMRLHHLQEAPTARSLAGFCDEFAALKEHLARLENYIHLFVDKHFTDQDAQALKTHSEEQFSQLRYATTEIWSHFALDNETIARFVKEEPSLQDSENLLKRKPAPPPYIPIEEKRAQAEAKDVRLADYSYLYRQVNSDPGRPKPERAAMVAKMFNAKLYQEWQNAKRAGYTPAGVYARQHGLSQRLLGDYMDHLPAFQEFARQPLTQEDKPAETNGQFFRQMSEFSSQTTYSWEEATTLVVKAFSRLHPDLGKLAHDAIADRWIDAAPSDAKKGGARAYGTRKVSVDPANHPYISMHFEGEFINLKTLAHEMGHAIARYLEGETSPNYSPQGALNETFALMGEVLLEQQMLEEAKTPEDRAAILAHKIRHPLHQATSNGSIPLEHALYDAFEQESFSMTPQKLAALTREFKGAGLSDDDALIELGRPVHMISYRPFYNMSYPLARMGAVAMMEKFSQLESPAERDAFAQSWIDVMRHANDHNYGTALKKMGLSAERLDNLIAPLEASMEQAREELRELAPGIRERAKSKAEVLEKLHELTEQPEEKQGFLSRLRKQRGETPKQERA